MNNNVVYFAINFIFLTISAVINYQYKFTDHGIRYFIHFFFVHYCFSMISISCKLLPISYHKITELQNPQKRWNIFVKCIEYGLLVSLWFLVYIYFWWKKLCISISQNLKSFSYLHCLKWFRSLCEVSWRISF